MPSRLEQICVEKGLKMTDQRRVISRVLSEATDHPDVEQVYHRAATGSIRGSPSATRLPHHEAVRGGDVTSASTSATAGRGTRRTGRSHHHHLIDLHTGEVIEFINDEIERMKQRIADELGYELVGHRLELYGVKRKRRDGG